MFIFVCLLILNQDSSPVLARWLLSRVFFNQTWTYTHSKFKFFFTKDGSFDSFSRSLFCSLATWMACVWSIGFITGDILGIFCVVGSIASSQPKPSRQQCRTLHHWRPRVAFWLLILTSFTLMVTELAGLGLDFWLFKARTRPDKPVWRESKSSPASGRTGRNVLFTDYSRLGNSLRTGPQFVLTLFNLFPVLVPWLWVLWGCWQWRARL